MLNRRRILLTALTAAAIMASPGLALARHSDALLHQIVASDSRSAHDKARDVYRHPEQTLAFWGLKPGDTVIDVQPGGGWWTDIIAPYLAQTGGHYIAAGADLDDPATGSEGRKDRAAFEAKYLGNPALYGQVRVVGFGPRSGALAPAGSVDFILVARATHNWVGGGFMQKAFADFYKALKPGGIMAIEDHRAAAGADPAKGNGYIPQAWLVEQAKLAGFVLAGQSEINANPKDTKDYPFGVWTLPPTRTSAPFGQPANPNFDHAPYDAIGESDRMTLKFVKPPAS